MKNYRKWARSLIRLVLSSMWIANCLAIQMHIIWDEQLRMLHWLCGPLVDKEEEIDCVHCKHHSWKPEWLLTANFLSWLYTVGRGHIWSPTSYSVSVSFGQPKAAERSWWSVLKFSVVFNTELEKGICRSGMILDASGSTSGQFGKSVLCKVIGFICAQCMWLSIAPQNSFSLLFVKSDQHNPWKNHFVPIGAH